MMNPHPLLCKGISLIVSAALVWGMAPATSLAADVSDGVGLTAPARSSATIDEMVEQMLSAGDYVPDQAIVCALLDGDELSAQSEGLLSDAEPLSSVLTRQYVEATGEVLPATQDTLSPQALEEEVQILLVERDGMGTATLLRELLADPRVLSAEPNYVMGFAEADDPAAGEDAEDVVAADPEDVVADNPEAEATDPELEPAAAAPEPEASDPATTPYPAADPDLTGYQWSVTGVANAVPQYVNATNPGINAPNWNQPGVTNASGVVVIMDSGVDYTHPDLRNVMYHFSPELQEELGCGEFGYAPAREDKTDPMDGLEHGTHCAGIVAAEWNDFGVSGVANGVQICAVSVANSLTNSTYCYDTVIKGYDFMIRAVEAGVDIRAVNRSLGLNPTNNANEAMMQAAGEAGIVTCIASGNENMDLDVAKVETSTSQSNPYAMRVNAASLQDSRAWFSCYGEYTTTLFAPGVHILSTVPSNIASTHSYFPQADDNPLYLLTDFSDIQPFVAYGEGEPNPDSSDEPRGSINGVQAADIGADGDGSSLKVSVTGLSEGSFKFYIDVPIGDVDLASMQDVRIAMYMADVEVKNAYLNIQLEDGSYSDSWSGAFENTSGNAPGGWSYLGMHVEDASKFGQGFRHVTDEQGRDCVRLSVSFMPTLPDIQDMTEFDADIYLDQISIGRSGNSGVLPYAYMNGTSMATPAVTGSAAIVSARLGDLTPAERAAATVRLLKGAVRQTPGYEGYCQQNGELDLRLLDDADRRVPVIEAVRVEGNAMTISGAYLGAQGTLALAGVPVQVTSWSDDQIVATWPEGVTSGLIPVVVTTAAGAQTHRAFALAAPESVVGSALLYERDLTSVSVLGTDPSVTETPTDAVALDDGTLFVTVCDNQDRLDFTSRYLMRSDDQGMSWSRIELPQQLKRVKICVGDGSVYVLGATPADNPVMMDAWHLYRMDPATGTFEELGSYDPFGEDVNNNGDLAYVGGHLYFADAINDGDDTDKWSVMRVRRFTDDFQHLESPFMLGHHYASYAFYYGPQVAVHGNSIYVLAVSGRSSSDGEKDVCGLERVDVAEDGTLSCADLSSAVQGAAEGLNKGNAHIAACEEGLFIVSRGLDALLPDGVGHTDTFLLRTGSTTFEPYPRTLSLAPIDAAVAVCSNGWLYAFATSDYEKWPVFARATEYAEPEPEPSPEPEPTPEPEPEPEPTPTPQPKPSPEPSAPAGRTTSTSSTKLPKTGDVPSTVASTLACAGLASVALALRMRKRREN